MLYSYSAKTYSGEIVKNEMEAANESEVARILKEKKLIILNIQKVQVASIKHFFSNSIPAKDKLVFTKELAVMLRSGLPIIDALENIKEQTENPQLKKIIENLITDISGGMNLYNSLAKFPRVFPPIFVNIVKSGEKSGKLDKTMERLAVQMEKDYDLQNKIKNALLYPILIFITLIAVIVLAIVFIIPQIKKIFDEMDIALPILTRILLGLSDIFISYWWIIILILTGVYFAFRTSISSQSFKLKWDKFKLNIPIYGPFIKKVFMARFLRSFEMLISSGVPINESLKISQNVIANLAYEKALTNIQQDVENGEQLSNALKKEKSFPPMIAQMIAVGEKSGKIDNILDTLSSYYDSEVENTTRNLTTILEPVLTIIMGIGIALVVASIIMPIYGLVNAI